MPKVLFLTESQGWSGGARQLLHLADGLRQRGFEVTLACPNQGDTFRRAKEQRFDPIDFFPRKDYDLPTAWRLARILDRENFDIVHAHHPRAHAVGLLSLYFARKKPFFLVTRRVSFSIPRNPFSRLKYCNSKIDRFVAVAESIRSILIHAGISPDKVVTIPSGVDLESFQPRAKDEAFYKQLNLAPGVPVIGLIANYGPWKGQGVFLKAAGLLKKRGRAAQFILAGRDTESPELKALAQTEGLEESDVRFLGFFRDVPRLLSILDVSVNAATEGEGLSGALRESLAMEIPVAASDIGGNQELISDKKTGRLFPIGDAPAAAQVFEELLSDPAGAKAMAKAGREDVTRRYAVDRMIASTADLYRKILERIPDSRKRISNPDSSGSPCLS